MKSGHCKNGHDMDATGSYLYRRKGRNGAIRIVRNCRQCKRDQWRRSGAAPKPGQARPAEMVELRRAQLTNEILQMVDAKWRAATAWERDELQTRIESLSRQL